MPQDVLDRILAVAHEEKALGPGSLEAFAAGLRERARLVLAERVRPLEERVAAVEEENAWRRGIMAALEEENGWRAGVMARLEKENEWTTAALETARGEVGRLKEEIEGLRAEWQTASATHDRLLGHHRGVLRTVIERLVAASALLPWSYRRARKQLRDLAADLGQEVIG